MLVTNSGIVLNNQMADFSDGGGLLVRTITSIETVKKHYFKSLLVLCF